MELLQKLVDALTVIANELKVMNEAGKRPMGRMPEAPPAPPALTPLPDPEEAGEERKKIKARLTELGVEFPNKAGMPRLQKMLAEAEEKARGTGATTPIDDVFATPAPEKPAATQEEVRTALVNAIDAFSNKEKAESPELQRQQGAAKVRELVIKHGGAARLSEIPAEKYHAVIEGLKAAVEALK